MRLGGMAASTSSYTGSNGSEDEEEDSWENDDSDGAVTSRWRTATRRIDIQETLVPKISYHDARMRLSHRNDSP